MMCAASVLIAVCWPGVSLAERPLILAMGLYGLTSGFLGYGLILFLVRPVPVLHGFLAVFVFYAGMVGLVVWLFLFAADVAYRAPMWGLARAQEFGLNITSHLGLVAAGFNAIQRSNVERRLSGGSEGRVYSSGSGGSG
jgi:hypothetical protein